MAALKFATLILVIAAAAASARLDPEKMPLSEIVVGSSGFSALTGSPGVLSPATAVPVSGRLLVGMVIGQIGAQVELANLRALLPAATQAGRLCLDVTTRDGSYLARNSFRYDTRTASAAVGLNYPTKYPYLLAGLKLSDLALRAEVKSDCAEPKEGVLVPVMFFDGAWAAPNALLVLVNAQDRVVTAHLRDHNRPLTDGACTKAVGGANVAFTDVCTFTGAKGHADTLRITTQGLLGTASDYDLRIALP